MLFQLQIYTTIYHNQWSAQVLVFYWLRPLVASRCGWLRHTAVRASYGAWSFRFIFHQGKRKKKPPVKAKFLIFAKNFSWSTFNTQPKVPARSSSMWPLTMTTSFKMWHSSEDATEICKASADSWQGKRLTTLSPNSTEFVAAASLPLAQISFARRWRNWRDSKPSETHQHHCHRDDKCQCIWYRAGG